MNRNVFVCLFTLSTLAFGEVPGRMDPFAPISPNPKRFNYTKQSAQKPQGLNSSSQRKQTPPQGQRSTPTGKSHVEQSPVGRAVAEPAPCGCSGYCGCHWITGGEFAVEAEGYGGKHCYAKLKTKCTPSVKACLGEETGRDWAELKGYNLDFYPITGTEEQCAMGGVAPPAPVRPPPPPVIVQPQAPKFSHYYCSTCEETAAPRSTNRVGNRYGNVYTIGCFEVYSVYTDGTQKKTDEPPKCTKDFQTYNWKMECEKLRKNRCPGQAD